MTSKALQDLIKTIRYKMKRGTTIKPDLDYLEEVLTIDLDKLEKLEKAIEILRAGAIATPCFPKIRTPMGDFFKMEFAIQKEKDFKFIQEVFENE